MRFRTLLVIGLIFACGVPGCRRAGIIAEGGGFRLTVERFRSEIARLGPSASFDDTYEDRYALVMNLAARKFLADEAESMGYGGEELERIVADAEREAVAAVYRRWKIGSMVMTPRIKTKPWIEKLDRRLHLMDLAFLLHPVAEEVLRDLKTGAPLSSIEQAALERDDVRTNDMGWVTYRDLPERVGDIVFRLDAGEASDIVSAGDGYHLFYVVEDAPLGRNIEILSYRSRRFVGAMETERLTRELKDELSDRYDVRFPSDGVARGLRAFAIAFSGERPPDSLMAGVVCTCSGGQVAVGDAFSTYFSLPNEERPYVGDYRGLTDFALGLLMSELEAAAGYEMGLDRDRDVEFAVRIAREDYLVPFMEDYFVSQVEVTPEDLEEYYEERKDDLARPGRYRIRRIVVDSWDAAGQARNQILTGTDFAEVARQVSQDDRTAAQGGDVGWVTMGLAAFYDSVVTDMQPGDVSRPFETYSGIEILKLEEREPGQRLTFEEAVPSMRVYITNTRANEMLDEFVSRKQEECGFTVKEDLLRRIRVPEPAYKKMSGLRSESDEVEEKEPSALPKID